MAWIEEQGTVVHSDATALVVQVQRKSTCGSCQARSGCGNGVLSQVFGRQPIEFRLPPEPDLKPGALVTLAVPDQSVVSGALVMYLLPLLALIIPAVLLGHWAPAWPEWVHILAGVAGFLLSLIWIRRWMRQRTQRYTPIMLRASYVVRE